MLLDLDTVEDGMIFKQCVRDRVVDSAALNQQILASDEETEVQEMLAGFSRKERKRILRCVRVYVCVGGVCVWGWCVWGWYVCVCVCGVCVCVCGWCVWVVCVCVCLSVCLSVYAWCV